jgi:RNA polymerase sigma factor (TIGR02999 family)
MTDDEISRLLRDSDDAGGDPARLLELVYHQLRAIAQHRMAGERRDHTLQATALVHEAYLRLVGDKDLQWAGRAHFFAAAAEAMRRILVEHARARGRVKRGGDGAARPAQRVLLNVLDLAEDADPDEFLALEEQIRRLETEDPIVGRVVRLRFFAALSGDETAAALEISPRQVDRLWSYARAWLQRALEPGRPEGRGEA